MSTAFQSTLTEELSDMTPATPRRNAAATLQSDWAAVRLSFDGWPATTTAVRRDKKEKMAEAVGAKKIGATVPKFDANHPAYKTLTAIKARIRDLWESHTLAWVEDGTRLLRQDQLSAFADKLLPLSAELDAARDEFRAAYPGLIDQAEEDNGELFDRSKYLPSFEGAYTFTVDYPSLAVPNYLQAMNPDLYAEASRRIAARFDAAVSMAEEAFTAELAEMLDTLQRKLSGLDDGTEKRLHDSTLGNLRDFFQRFRSLNLHSSAELDRVVDQAETALSGRNLIGGQPVTREELRDSASIRRDVRTRLSAVSATLDGLMTAAPLRAITRRNKHPAPATADTTTTPPQE